MFRLHPILERLIFEPVDAFLRLDKDLAFAEAPQRVFWASSIRSNPVFLLLSNAVNADRSLVALTFSVSLKPSSALPSARRCIAS
jgi:hypothetical protein